MARLIDVDKALELFETEYRNTAKLIDCGETHLDSLAEGFNEAANIIKYIALPVDAVPVVRCPKCKYHRENEGFHFCKRMGVYCPDDSEFFCAYGED